MSLRAITRISAAGFAVCLVGALLATALAPGAGAVTQERITIHQDDVKELVYPALIGNVAVNQVDGSTAYQSGICETATTCDAIPLTIEAPVGITELDEYYVTIELIWETQEIQNVPLFGEFTVNDLDMYIVNDPLVPGSGPDEDGFAYASNGTAQPERIAMFKPQGNFIIYIGNSSGTNLGYRLKLTWATDVLPNPFESLPPGFTGATPRPTTPAGRTPTPAALPSSGSTGDLPELGNPDLSLPAVGAPDTAFDAGFSDAPSLDDVIVAPQIETRRVADVKGDPPTGIALMLWMLAIPLGLVALGGAFLMRRSQRLLSF